MNVQHIDQQNSADLAVLLLGGTIGSSTFESELDVDVEGSGQVSLISRICELRGLSWVAESPFHILSEGMEPSDWAEVADSVKSLLDRGFKSIVISHGTDTMAYTASALDMLFRGADARIVLTGSFYNLEHPYSDAELNMEAAIVTAASSNLESGVYVCFGDSTGDVPVTPASELLPMRFDSRRFDSRYDFHLGHVDLDSGFRHYDFSSYQPQKMPYSLDFPNSWSSYPSEGLANVYQLTVYPGIDFSSMVESYPVGSIVLVSLFHSGTASSGTGPESLMTAIQTRPDLDFVLGPLPSAIDPPYATTVKLASTAAKIYKDLTIHSLYVWFVLGQMAGKPKGELFEFIEEFELKV